MVGQGGAGGVAEGEVIIISEAPGTQWNLQKGLEAMLSRAIGDSYLLWVPYS